MKWNEIPSALKMTAGAVTGVLTMVAYLSLYQTDAEAMELEQRVVRKMDDTRIEVNEQKIKDYEFKLLAPGLTAEQIDWIDRQIKSLDKKNDCIREKKC